MRRLLKWLGITVGAVIVVGLLGVGGAIFVAKRAMTKTYAVDVESLAIPDDPESIEEGRRLVSARSCAECHGADLGGKVALQDPALGTIWGANITRGKGGVVSAFGDVDWVRAIRHGLKTDGTPILLMPSEEFYWLSDRDLGALIAYLKVAPPVDRENQPHVIKPLLSVLTAAKVFPLLAARGMDHAAVRKDPPEPGVSPAFGAYLASIQCVGCHGEGLGGGPLPGAPPSVPVPANLTPDPDSGLGKWSQEDFAKALRTGKRPDGRELDLFMPWKTYQHLNDTEVEALWAYLQTIPVKPFGSR